MVNPKYVFDTAGHVTDGQPNLVHSSNPPLPQGQAEAPPAPLLYPPPLNLAIHTLAPAPVHPLSRRYQPSLPSPTTPLRIEDYISSPPPPHHTELHSTTPQQANANQVRRASEPHDNGSEALANQTKDSPGSSPGQAQRPRDTNMSMAKAATEKLKWKFLGW